MLVLVRGLWGQPNVLVSPFHAVFRGALLRWVVLREDLLSRLLEEPPLLLRIWRQQVLQHFFVLRFVLHPLVL